MRFQNSFVSQEHRYALGEINSGRHFAAIPVTNRMVDYIEVYKISEDEYQDFLINPGHALEFIESCRRREQDDRLFVSPGDDRGTPV